MSVPRGTPGDSTISEVTALYYCPFCNPLGLPGGGTFQVGTESEDASDLRKGVLLHSNPPCDRFLLDEPFHKTLRAARLAGLREVLRA